MDSLIFQLLVSGIISGSLYGLMGVSWGIIYSTTRIFHFAHGLVFTFAAYMMIVFRVQLGTSIVIALLFGIITASILCSLIEIAVYRPIRRIGGAPFTIFLASMGAMIFGEAVLHLIFHPTPRPLPGFEEKLITLGSTYFTSTDLGAVITSWLLVLLLSFYLNYTKWGREIRAVRSSREMSTIVGIDIDRVYILVFIIGSALAAFGAFFITTQSAAVPGMGLHIVLMAFIAVFVGGIGKFWGIALAGLLIGLIESVSLLWFSAQYMGVVVFTLMFILLLFKPEGLMGEKTR